MRNPLSATTKGFYIGSPEAEAENNPKVGLLQFFEDFLEIQDKVDSGKFIISGRKGSGKSAFAQHIYQNCKNSDSDFSCIITPQNFKAESILQLIPEDKKKEYKSLLFEWIILIHITKFIVESKNGIYLDEVKTLSEFLRKNAGRVEIDKYVVSLIEQGRETDLNIIPFKSLGSAFKKVFNTKQTKAPFWAMIPLLEDTIAKVLRFEVFQDTRFTVIFDDLDIDFNIKEEDSRNQLMDLIRVSKRYNQELFSQTNSKVVLLLRDDICKSIKEFNVADSAKVLDSYSYHINWYCSDNKDEDTLIRQFINKRIEQNFINRGIKYNKKDPWMSFVDEDSFRYELGKSVFKYILNHTFCRPRDLVLMFNNIGDKSFTLPLSLQNIKKLLKQYVNAEKHEISNELSTYYTHDEIDRIFDFFGEVSKDQRSYNEVIKMLEDRMLDKNVFHQLVSHDLLVPKDSAGHLHLSYREAEVTFGYEKYDYRLHKCLYQYFQQ